MKYVTCGLFHSSEGTFVDLRVGLTVLSLEICTVYVEVGSPYSLNCPVFIVTIVVNF